MKTKLYFIALISALVIFSCKNNAPVINDSEVAKSDEVKGDQGIYPILSEQLSGFTASYKSSTRSVDSVTVSKEREKAIAEVFGKFESFIQGKYNRNSDEMVQLTIENDKFNQTISIVSANIIKPREMDPIALGIAFGIADSTTRNSFLSSELRSAAKEKITLVCEGGTKNGATMTVDRPTNKLEGLLVGNKVAPFIAACLDGNGCVKVCSTSMIVQ